MSNKIWYRWPENYHSGFVPWFVALRRLIFWPALMIGLCVAYVAIMGGFGRLEADRFWKSV